MFLFVLFIVVPILELTAINQVADWLGWGWTILLLFGDSLAGAFLVKREGRRAWLAFRTAISEARWPGDEVAQGALVLVGGALLLTPGFLTDIFGLMLVLPITRAIAAAIVKRRIVPVPIQVAGTVHDHVRQGRAATDPNVIDVEVVSVDRRDDAIATDGQTLDAGAPDEGPRDGPDPSSEVDG